MKIRLVALLFGTFPFFAFPQILQDKEPTPDWKNKIWKDGIGQCGQGATENREVIQKIADVTVIEAKALGLKSQAIEVVVENSMNFQRTSEMIELSANDIRARLSLSDTNNLAVKNDLGKIVLSQLTYDGKLIFQVDIKPKSQQTYYVSSGKRQDYEAKVFGRHYLERMGDFAWENDCVGFRFYGKELKEIQSPTSGIDLWYKRTDKLVLDKWYADNQSGKSSYHEDHGEGCDPYAVGQSLGGGSSAIFTDSILHMNDNFESFEILDNGPLRVTTKLIYPPLQISGKEVYENRTVSLDAGSQLTQIVQEYNTTDKETIVAIGFSKRTLGDSILYSVGNDYFIYQEPADEKNGQIYLGMLIPQGIKNVIVSNKTRVGNSADTQTSLPNIVAISNYKNNKPITYYTGFGWNKFGFNNAEEFKHYMQIYSEALKNPLIIKIK